VTTPAASSRTPAPVPRPVRDLRPALLRYRVMAWVTGSFLLLLSVEIVLKYGFNGGEPVLGTWIAITHGWIFVAYLLTVVDLWLSMRWGFGHLTRLVLSGVVPLLSFWTERATTREVQARIAAAPR
jgi:integral membrane protein